MNISSKLLPDKAAISLIAGNVVLACITILTILLRVSSSDSSSTIIQYRSNLGAFAFKSGSTSDLQSFALFTFVSTGLSLLIASKFFSHRRHLAISLLAMQVVIILLTLIISSALIAVN